MAPSEEPTGHTVIIGIDFGTTYSGVAFTWSDKIEKMEVIRSWPSELHSNSDEPKVPTAISFAAKGKADWGYGIPADAEQLKWFKLLLVDDKDLPADVRKSAKLSEAREYLKKHNKTVTEAISLFLRHLWNHSIQRITETVSRNLINFSKFHIVVTVPAIWPEYARARMREAASLAGMLGKRIAGETELSFISEPEGAALATLSDMDGRHDIKAGHTFVVVDCGGGTADLISYEVASISPMVVRECVQGQGGLCGAVFADEAFQKMLKKKFGSAQWDKMKAQSRTNIIHAQWEHMIKPDFDGRDRTWEIAVPFECLDLKLLKAAAELPTVQLNAEDVRGVFSPTVDKIREMVKEQVAAVRAKKGADPKYIILVGGFGRSQYLFASLKGTFGHDIEVLQSRGAGPWTAICRGAVIHAATIKGLPAFSVQVHARVARASCGIHVSVPWNHKKHQEKDKFWDEQRQAWRAKNQMEWLLKAGDDISTGKPVKSAFHCLFGTDESTACHGKTTTIYMTKVSPPPQRWHVSVEKLCEIRWDTDIDITTLPTFTNEIGKVFYELNFEVEMTCVAGSLDFAVYHKGKRQGSKHVVVDYETRS